MGSADDANIRDYRKFVNIFILRTKFVYSLTPMPSLQGSRLKQLRKEADLNQHELAEKLGIQNHQISRYERDAGNPSVEILADMAQFFDVTTDYLLGLSDIPDPRPTDLSPNEREVVAMLRTLDADAQAQVVTALKLLRDAWQGE